MINLNELAVEISKREGKLKQVDIAQIKEIMRIMLTCLSEQESKESGSVIELLKKYKS